MKVGYETSFNRHFDKYEPSLPLEWIGFDVHGGDGMTSAGPFELHGIISSRSSAGPGQGPPGEVEIHHLNPQRARLICAAAGWDCLEPGSLNVEVDEQALRQWLDGRSPDVFEAPGSVVYPAPYEKIPMRRQGYRYYRCSTLCGNVEAAAFVRRAVVPLPGRVELFSRINLRRAFNATDGASVTIKLTGVAV